MNDLTINAPFDYSQMDDAKAEVVRGGAERIKANIRVTMERLLEVGRELVDMKRIIPHGQFGAWLKAEFDWSQDTAERYMQVAVAFDQIPHGADFTPTALYFLSSPSVPEAAREEAKERAAAGERITPAVAKEIVAQHQQDDDPEPINTAETSRPQESTSYEEPDDDALEQAQVDHDSAELHRQLFIALKSRWSNWNHGDGAFFVVVAKVVAQAKKELKS